MEAEDLNAVQNIQAALDILPAEKREYIVGYAEGVLAMSEQYRAAQDSA